MANSIIIDRGAPDGDHGDVLGILYDVAREVRESRIGSQMDHLHKYGGTLTAEMVAGWRRELSDLSDRAQEIADALSEVQA